MALFHFHIVTGIEREHVGTLDLPSSSMALPASVHLTMKVLVDIVMAGDGEKGMTLQATDSAGIVVCNLDVGQNSKDERKPDAYFH